jgi:2-oxoglutarate ferredoxin oxidoreductase subunit alpha
MFDLTVRAFNLAEQFRVPVIVLGEEAVGHLRETVTIPQTIEVFQRKRRSGAAPFGANGESLVPPMPAFGEGARLLVSGSTHDAWGIRQTDNPEVHASLVARSPEKILRARQTIVQTESLFLDDAELAVVAYGFTARSALYAVKRLREEGKAVGFLRLRTLWPFPEDQARALDSTVGKVLMPEMNRGQVAGELQRYVTQPVISLPQTNGEVIHPRRIIEEVRRML